MTAEVKTPVSRADSRYYGVRFDRGSSRACDTTLVAALAGITTANSISDLLDLIEAQHIRESGVTADGFGGQTRVDAV